MSYCRFELQTHALKGRCSTYWANSPSCTASMSVTILFFVISVNNLPYILSIFFNGPWRRRFRPNLQRFWRRSTCRAYSLRQRASPKPFRQSVCLPTLLRRRMCRKMFISKKINDFPSMFCQKRWIRCVYPLTMHHPSLNDIRLSALVLSLGF